MVGEDGIWPHCQHDPDVSVSLPRLGGWRGEINPARSQRYLVFQSRCRDWVVGEADVADWIAEGATSFSLVAEIGWLASL